MIEPMQAAAGNLRGRLGFLEGLRGFGAAVVALHHLVLGFFPWVLTGQVSPHAAGWEQALGRFPAGLLFAGGFAVQVFFVLSGVVLALPFVGPGARADSHLAAAAAKRIFRLAPMVYAAMGLVWVLQTLDWVPSREAGVEVGSRWLGTKPAMGVTLPIVARSLASPFLYGHYFDSPLWTIETELYGSFLVFFVVWIVRRCGGYRWWVYGWLLLWLRGDPKMAFVVGAALADLYRSGPRVVRWAGRGWVWVPLCGMGLYLGSIPYSAGAGSVRDWAFGLPVPADAWASVHRTGAVLLVAAVLASPWLQRMLDHRVGLRLGRLSYGLYATHEVLIISAGSAVYLALVKGGGHTAAGMAAAVVVLGLAWPLAELATRWVDQPSIRLADRVGRWIAGAREQTRDRAGEGGGVGARDRT